MIHLVYAAPFLLKNNCIAIVFNFSWDDCNNQEKLETMLMNCERFEPRSHFKRLSLIVRDDQTQPFEMLMKLQFLESPQKNQNGTSYG